VRVGSETFGLPYLMEAAVEVAQAAPRGTDLVVMTWDTFVRLMYQNEADREAFDHAWPPEGVVRFLVSQNLDIEAAKQVSQETAISAWRSLRYYKAYRSAWNTWIIHLAIRRRVDYLRRVYRRPRTAPLELATHHETITVAEERGWSVPIVAAEWLASAEPIQRQVAADVMAAYDGDSFPGRLALASEDAGFYSYRVWFQRFIEGVQRRENYGR
jgi:hypothetical protein